MARLNYCIERLEPQIKEVLKDVFIEKLQWKNICDKRSISSKTLNRNNNKAIDAITSNFSLGRLVN